MKCDTYARFALSVHEFRTHFSGAEEFSGNKKRGYTPKILRNAYAWSGEFGGEGTKIAVISAFDNVAVVENVRVFCQVFNLPFPNITTHYPFGRAQSTSRKWLTESSLDAQWAHVFAPGADIDVVFSPDASVKNLLSCARYADSELSADVICMCFGSDETGLDEELSEIIKSQRGIFVSSSGDVGGRVSFPSTSPYCVSVGGTSLKLSESGERLSETAWQNTGGGASSVFHIPPYQGRFYNIYGEADGMRGTPDISMNANFSPGAVVYISSLGGWTTVGGTSLSAACFSGICACIKQAHPELITSSDILSFLYSKAGTSGYEIPQYNYKDITFGRSGEFFAKEGWDFCTGLGSPVIRRILL